jgi:hypothetical protein
MKKSRLIFVVIGIVLILKTELYSQKPIFELKDIDNKTLTYSEF